MKQKTGLYAGSFDPFTLGHLDIVKVSLLIVDSLIIAIGAHPNKNPHQDITTRKANIKKAVAPLSANIKVISYDDLLVECAARENATMLIRGVRNNTDFDYEQQLAGMNNTLVPDLPTVFLFSNHEHTHISSTLVRQIAAMGGDVSKFVP